MSNARTMELNEWIEAIDLIREEIRKTSEEVDVIMTRLGYTEQQQQELRWVFI